jgi:integrase
MTRRAPGEGTIGKEGDSWVARVDLPPGPDGRRRRIRRRAKSKAEAAKILRQLREELDEVDNPAGLRRTITTAVETYLATVPTKGGAAKTIEMRQWRGSVIVAGLGRRQVGKLTVADCDAFLVAAAEGRYGQRPIGNEALRRIRSLLIKVVQNEQRLGNLARNVAELSIMPMTPAGYEIDDLDGEDGEGETASRRSLTHDEFRRLWHVARQPLIVVVDLCGRNGLRPSEARALRWECVDLDAGTVIVNRQMSSTNRLTGVKTKNADRVITVDERTATVLVAWQVIQERKKARAGDRWSSGPAFVFSTRYGTAINRFNLVRMVTAAATDAGIDLLRPYELRHTAITHQRMAGRDTADVADWAGTSERMVNEVYRHRLDARSDLRPIDIPGLDDEELGPNPGPTTN